MRAGKAARRRRRLEAEWTGREVAERQDQVEERLDRAGKDRKWWWRLGQVRSVGERSWEEGRCAADVRSWKERRYAGSRRWQRQKVLSTYRVRDDVGEVGHQAHEAGDREVQGGRHGAPRPRGRAVHVGMRVSRTAANRRRKRCLTQVRAGLGSRALTS